MSVNDLLQFRAVAVHNQGRIQDFFKKGVVSMRVQRQTSQGQRNGRGRVGEGLRVRVTSEYVDFLFWISEEFEVLFISSLPRRLHGDHCEIRESLLSRCLQTLIRRRWMLEKSSSSKSPIASKRLFGSFSSVDCLSAFHLRTSFPFFWGNEMSFSHYAFFFIIQL